MVVGGSTVVLLVLVQPRLKRLGVTAFVMQRSSLMALQQALDGVRDVKLLGRERYFSATFGNSTSRLARTSYIRAAASQLPRVVIETSLIGFILLYFAITIYKGGGAQSALAVLGLFGYAGLRLQPSLQRIVAGLNDLKFSTAPVADLHQDLLLIESQPPEPGALQLLQFEHRLALEGVTFRYEGAHRDALSDVSLSIGPGEQIGICGPTGGGKSTLVDVISGLLVPRHRHCRR